MPHAPSILRFTTALACLSTALAQDPAAEDDIRGPKPPVEIPTPEAFPIALWATIAGVLLIIILALILWQRHARKQQLKSPQQIALASLDELQATRENLTAESFADRAAQTVRQYLFARFGLAAPRRTTEEFLRDLTADSASPVHDHCDHLRAFLKSCDLAKFAGVGIDPARRSELLEAARGFIAATAAPTTSPEGKKP